MRTPPQRDWACHCASRNGKDPMHRFTQQAVMLFTLLTLPPAVLAGSTTYNLVNHPDYQDGWTLSGTITTDGTIGLLQSSDITSWTWTVTKPGSSQTYRSGPGTVSYADGLTATNTGLLILIRTTSTAAEILLNTNSGGINDGYGNIGGGSMSVPTYYTGAAGLLQADHFVFYWGDGPSQSVAVPQEEFTFASTTAVPEPASLYLLGFAAVCVSVYVMGHKVMGHKRRERRTATTA